MIKTASYWELGWNTPILEVDLYQYVLEDFNVDEIYMHPVSGIDNNRISERKNLETIFAENPELLHSVTKILNELSVTLHLINSVLEPFVSSINNIQLKV